MQIHTYEISTPLMQYILIVPLKYLNLQFQLSTIIVLKLVEEQGFSHFKHHCRPNCVNQGSKQFKGRECQSLYEYCNYSLTSTIQLTIMAPMSPNQIKLTIMAKLATKTEWKVQTYTIKMVGNELMEMNKIWFPTFHSRIVWFVQT